MGQGNPIELLKQAAIRGHRREIIALLREDVDWKEALGEKLEHVLVDREKALNPPGNPLEFLGNSQESQDNLDVRRPAIMQEILDVLISLNRINARNQRAIKTAIEEEIELLKAAGKDPLSSLPSIEEEAPTASSNTPIAPPPPEEEAPPPEEAAEKPEEDAPLQQSQRAGSPSEALSSLSINASSSQHDSNTVPLSSSDTAPAAAAANNEVHVGEKRPRSRSPAPEPSLPAPAAPVQTATVFKGAAPENPPNSLDKEFNAMD